MDRATALVRLADFAERRALPVVERLLRKVLQSVEQVGDHVLGDDFHARMECLREHYEALGPDPFGLDPAGIGSAAKACAFLHRVYFRTEVHGVNNVPPGPVILAANHSGQIPMDAALIGCSMLLDAHMPRLVRAMVDRWVGTLPYVSTFFSRMGQVIGVPDNARRLLGRGEIVLVFPEGIRGVSKPFSQRYQLQEFTHGFVRLALQSGAPIVPVAVLGAEEQYVSLGNVEWAARAMKWPVFPLLPQLLLPGGQAPLPTRYRIHFGEPMRLEGDEDDDTTVREQSWLVRQMIHHLIQRGLAERRSVFW